MKLKVYLDSCSINRLTDDQTQARIRTEAEAITRILDLVSAGEVTWIGSSFVRLELSRNSNPAKRTTSLDLLMLATEFAEPDPATYQRAFVLQAEGYGSFDALHLALAEQSGAEWLITVDDRFLNRAARRPGSPLPTVLNPIDWIQRRQLWLLKR